MQIIKEIKVIFFTRKILINYIDYDYLLKEIYKLHNHDKNSKKKLNKKHTQKKTQKQIVVEE